MKSSKFCNFLHKFGFFVLGITLTALPLQGADELFESGSQQNSSRDTISSVAISPNVVPLKVSIPGEPITEIPELTFAFQPADEDRTLTVEWNWFSVGYPGFASRQDISTQVPTGQRTLSLKIPDISHFGLYQVTTTLRSNDPFDISVGAYGHTMVAVVPDNTTEKECSGSPFGCGTNFSSLAPSETLDTIVHYARVAGVRWAREELPIDLYAPETVYTSAVKSTVNTIRTLQKNNILVTAAINPRSVLTPYTKVLNPADIKSFSTRIVPYINSLTTQESGKSVSIWELPGFSQPLEDLSPYLYAKLFESVQFAISKTNNKSQLLLPESGTTWTLEFLQKSSMPKNSNIAFNYHLRFHDTEVGNLWDYFDKRMGNLKTLGYTGHPYVTEIGWTANHSSSWQERQADYLVQSYVIAMSRGYERIFWENFICASGNPTDMTYGLLSNKKLLPRASYVSYAAMVHMLENTIFEKSGNLGNGIAAHYFRDRRDNAQVAVIWCKSQEAGTLTPPNNVPYDWQWFDQFGNSHMLDSMQIQPLTISRTPIYLRSKTGHLEQELSKWQLSGFPQFSLAPHLPPVFVEGQTFPIVIQNTSQASLKGKLRFSSTNITLQCDDVLKIDPGTSATVQARIAQFRRLPDNLYSVRCSFSNLNNLSSEVTMSLSEHIIYRGTVNLDTAFDDWQSAMPFYKILHRDMSDIRPFMDWSSSATSHLLCDNNYLYFESSIDAKTLKISGHDILHQLQGIRLNIQPLDNSGKPKDVYHIDVQTSSPSQKIIASPNGTIVALKRESSKENLVGIRLEAAIPLTLMPSLQTTSGNLVQIYIEPSETEFPEDGDFSTKTFGKKNNAISNDPKTFMILD